MKRQTLWVPPAWLGWSEEWRGRLFAGGIKAIGIQLVGMMLTFAVNVLMARAAGLQGYGMYSFVITCASFAAVAGRLGIDTAVVKFVPECLATGNWSDLRGLLRASIGLVMAASVIAALAIAAILILTQRWSTESSPWMVSAIILLVLAVSYGSLAQGFLRGLGWIGRSLLGGSIIRPLLLALLVAIGWGWYTAVLPAQVMLLLAAGAWCLSVVVSWFWVFQSSRQRIPEQTPATYAVRKWVGVALPLLGIGALNMTLTRADILLVGALANDREVGYYAAASRITNLISFGLAALNTVAAPLIAELYAASRLREMHHLINLVIRIGSFAGVIVVVILFFLGHWILAQFGSGFEEGWAPLMILAVGQIVNIAVGPVGYILAMTGSDRKAFWILLEGAVLNVLVGGICVAQWGAIGAAVATSLAMIFWNVAMVKHIGQRFGFWILPFYGIRRHDAYS
ncbi:MAG: oligosaccharide flippase family protein [Gammaproteobacteria bacterium]